MRCLIGALACLICLVITGEPLLGADPEPEITYRHYAEPYGEIISYMYIPNIDAMLPSDEFAESGVVFIAGIPSGEKFIEYESERTQVLFSPDGQYVTKIQLALDRNGQAIRSLSRTNDDSELWNAPFGTDVEVPPMNLVWDEERDFLIGASYILPEIDETEDTSVLADTLESELISTFIRVYRLSNGELLAEAKISLSFTEMMNVTEWIGYGGGKLFIVAKDDPFAAVRDLTREDFDLYAIEPVTWETQRIDMRGLYSRNYLAKALVNRSGDKLFFQPGVSDPENSLTLLGSDVFEISLTTGEWRKLIDMDKKRVYELHGITPDGSKVCCSEISKDNDGKIKRIPMVFDNSTGEKRYYEPVYEGNKIPRFQISHSGLYMTEYALFDDLWVHDLDTGEREILIDSDEYPVLLPYPGITGSWNVRF